MKSPLFRYTPRGRNAVFGRLSVKEVLCEVPHSQEKTAIRKSPQRPANTILGPMRPQIAKQRYNGVIQSQLLVRILQTSLLDLETILHYGSIRKILLMLFGLMGG